MFFSRREGSGSWMETAVKKNKTGIFYNLHPEVTGDNTNTLCGPTHLKVVCIVFL